MGRSENIIKHGLLGLATLATLAGCASPCGGPAAQPLVTWSPMRHHSARFCPAEGGAFFGHYGTCWFRWPVEWVPCPLLDHPPAAGPLSEPPPPPGLEELMPPMGGGLPPPMAPEPPGAESPSDVNHGFPPTAVEQPPAEIEPMPADTSRHSPWDGRQGQVVRAHYFGPLAPIAVPSGEFERVSAATFQAPAEPWAPPAMAYPRRTNPHGEAPPMMGAPQ